MRWSIEKRELSCNNMVRVSKKLPTEVKLILRRDNKKRANRFCYLLSMSLSEIFFSLGWSSSCCAERLEAWIERFISNIQRISTSRCQRRDEVWSSISSQSIRPTPNRIVNLIIEVSASLQNSIKVFIHMIQATMEHALIWRYEHEYGKEIKWQVSQRCTPHRCRAVRSVLTRIAKLNSTSIRKLSFWTIIR